MPTMLNELETKRNALSAFIAFHRQSGDPTIRIVRLSGGGVTPEVGPEESSFREEDVKCRRIDDGWACVIQHIHVSKTQKGVPYIFEYGVGDDPIKARYDCKPVGQAAGALLK